MSEGITPPEGKYICFMAGPDRYGIPIGHVLRVICREEIIEVPHAPRYVKGVIHQRGEVIPIIDFRDRFNLPGAESSRRRRIVIIQSRGRPYGLLVDEVRDIVEVKGMMVERDPASGFGPSADLVTGVARVGENAVILLDIARVISAEGLSA